MRKRAALAIHRPGRRRQRAGHKLTNIQIFAMLLSPSPYAIDGTEAAASG
jgi:hypothetical protein